MELKLFENEELGSVRVVNIEGDPWFVGKDIAERLGYTNPSEALQYHVENEDKLNSKSLSSSENYINLGQRGGWLINESGLYSLVLSSKLPVAKQFKRWITSEVIPSIRKTGSYGIQRELPKDFASALRMLATEVEKTAELEEKIEHDKPLVEIGQGFTDKDGNIYLMAFHSVLESNGYKIGRNNLYKFLRELNFITYDDTKVRGTYWAISQGYIVTVKKDVKVAFGAYSYQNYITQKGKQYVLDHITECNKVKIVPSVV